MKVSITRRAVLRAAIKGHAVKTRDLKASKARLKALSNIERKKCLLDVISDHRRDFRREGRQLHLAYNFAKGTPYEMVETYRDNVDLPKMAKAISDLVRCTESPVREWLGLPVVKPKTARELVKAISDLVRCTESPVREWLGLPVVKPKTARELAQIMGRAL